MSVYHKLREIGVSVETADAVANLIKNWPQQRQLAIVLWASGYTQVEAANACGIHLRTFERDIGKLRMSVFYDKIGLLLGREGK